MKGKKNLKEKIKRPGLFLGLFLAAAILFSACGNQEKTDPDHPRISGIEIEHEKEFGGIYIRMTIDEFNQKGFVYGDSVDVEFSNGYSLKDIPYYNGYYVEAGKPLLIAYPGYDYIKAAINYGDDLWERIGLDHEIMAVRPVLKAGERDIFTTGGMDEKTTASVALRERGKYRDIQEARDIHYTDIRTDYPSDEVFANFRNMTAGNLKKGMVYRSASPCDNQHNRAPYVDALMKEAGVQSILDLADNVQKIEKYISGENFNSPYFLELYRDKKVTPLGLNMNYLSDDFRLRIAEGFKIMAASEGPFLIHCTEGKDRTGFVCMLLEALTGASYQEIVDDYMLTYDNYYEIRPEKQKEKYDVILDQNLNAMLRFLTQQEDADAEALAKADLKDAAVKFLVAGGMNKKEIVALTRKITED